jgi:hypothetical protein
MPESFRTLPYKLSAKMLRANTLGRLYIVAITVSLTSIYQIEELTERGEEDDRPNSRGVSSL